MTAAAAYIALAALLGGADVTARVEPPVTPYHRPVALILEARVPDGAEVELPELSDEQLAGLPVHDFTAAERSDAEDGTVTVRRRYSLDPIFMGNYALPPITVRIDGEDVVIPGPVITVRDLTPEERAEAERFADPAPVLGPPARRSWIGWTVAAAIGVVALGGAMMWWLRRRAPVAREVPVPPWEAAYRALRELDQANLAERGEAALFHVELSGILRRYIEERFHLHAPERTTQEFLAEAHDSGALSEEHQRLLARFLRHCDRVKFAQYTPTLDQMEQSFAEVLQFVDETVPAPLETQEEAA
jgi:hypothetical protein